MPVLKYFKCNVNAKSPTKANKSDAGLDIYSCENVVLESKQQHLFKTGLKFLIPDGYKLVVFSKSGLALKKRISHRAGLIDNGYTGELGLIIVNESDVPVQFDIGSPIAQIVLERDEKYEVEEMFEEPRKEERNENGFGSSYKM